MAAKKRARKTKAKPKAKPKAKASRKRTSSAAKNGKARLRKVQTQKGPRRGVVRLDEIQPAPYNPRMISEDALGGLGESLDRFGLVQPIVVNVRTNRIVGGHQRAKALEARGAKTAEAVLVDLPESEEKALNIALNSSRISGEWTAEALPLIDEILLELPEVGADLLLDELRANLLDQFAEAGGGKTVSLAERFLIPPFSVLDARQGYWQLRKAAWLALGIESEVGRDAMSNALGNTFKGSTAAKNKILNTGTSIFDPVLCEIANLWFCPPGGVVLDPFAGGSVRGIVSARLGRDYVGVDLSKKQVAANRKQAKSMLGGKPSRFVDVKVSVKSARLLFHGCEPAYIADVCHGSCCRSSTQESGILVTVHSSEEERVAADGATIEGGRIIPRSGEKRCPYQGPENLCGVHGTTAKPFGCIASPFTLNANSTLIVRNRYRMLKCFKDGELPAYVAFRASLDLIFGKAKAANLCAHLDAGGGDVTIPMPIASYRMLVENDAAKHDRAPCSIPTHEGDGKARWIIGDAATALPSIKADLVFTCPPYGDLEVYSDDERDLSTMDPDAFRSSYAEIIKQAAARLRDDRFAVFVVGDYRRKDGPLSDFVSLTIRLAADAGLDLYNEIILITALGTTPLTTSRNFPVSRKVGKTHQNVLVFVKGDGRRATEACGPITVEVPSDVDEGEE